MRARAALKALAGSFALLAAVALTMVVRAPAAWLGDWVQARSALRLVDGRGTLWDGSGMLALSDGQRAFLLPGRFSWRLNTSALARGRVDVVLSHPAFAGPVVAGAGTQGVRLGAGRLHVPAAILAALGGPLRTVRPGGTIEMRWSDLRVQGGMLAGEIQADWRDAQSALSSVAPLGSYRGRIDGTGGGPARVTIETLNGPLRLQGTGGWSGGRLTFRGTASADPEMRHLLEGLLGVLGPRSGDNVLLVLEG